jgi:hypothetical protein
LAFSLTSLGSTICPRSSTVINDSTLQQLTLPADGSIQDVLFLAIQSPLEIIQFVQINQNMLKKILTD